MSLASVRGTGSTGHSRALPPLGAPQAEPLDVALLDSPVHSASGTDASFRDFPAIKKI